MQNLLVAVETLIKAHPYAATTIAYWVFSAAIDALPDTKDTSGLFYQWLYKFLHTLAGNLSTLNFFKKVQGVQK